MIVPPLAPICLSSLDVSNYRYDHDTIPLYACIFLYWKIIPPLYIIFYTCMSSTSCDPLLSTPPIWVLSYNITIEKHELPAKLSRTEH